MSAMRVNLPYLVADRGMVYVRRNGRKVRIRAMPGSPAFAAAYAEALERLGLPDGAVPRGRAPTAPRGTAAWLAQVYYASAEFRGLAAKSQATRRAIIDKCMAEVAAGRRFGDTLAHAVTAAHVKLLRDRASGPGAANNRRKYLSSMFGWAVEAGHMPANPARDVRRKKYASSGFYTWSVEDVRRYEVAHPIGTKARLALALLLFTGCRRQDVVKMGRQHAKGGYMRFVPKKTSYKRLDAIVLPILPALAEIIQASPTGDLTYLTTDYGRPFSAAGFGARFRKWCDDAGLPMCTAHGLRKAGATIAAENGATDRQLMALYGWTSAAQATTYTAAADRQKMAGEAVRLLGKTGTDETLSDDRIVSPDKKRI